MDIVYGLVGGLVLTWLLGMVIKKTWLAAIVAYLIVVIVLGMMPAGIQPTTLGSALVGAAIAAYFIKPKSDSK